MSLQCVLLDSNANQPEQPGARQKEDWENLYMVNLDYTMRLRVLADIVWSARSTECSVAWLSSESCTSTSLTQRMYSENYISASVDTDIS